MRFGAIKPLRYRGYYYDTETGFYYCTSRYYDPETYRWINADVYASTGQGILGYNMFTYCLNNSVNYMDRIGTNAEVLSGWSAGMSWLPFIDTVFPVGDIIYIGGIVLLSGVVILSNCQESDPEISDDDSDIDQNPTLPDNDYDDYDDYYDDESNYGGRERVGKSKGNAPRNNQAQNKQFKDATKGLTPEQQRIVHNKITGKGLGFNEIKAIIKDLFGYMVGIYAFEESQ